MSKLVSVVGAMALVGAVAPGGSPATASPDDGAVIGSLPFRTLDAHDGPLLEGTGPASAAVASTCIAGRPVYAPSWWRWRAPDAQAIVAFAVDHTEPGMTSAAGVAIVSADDATVLACDSAPDANTRAQAGPVALADGQEARIVSYIAESSEYAVGAGEFMGLHVAATGGHPANDDVADATSIPSLPYTETIDTVLATPEPGDGVSHSPSTMPGRSTRRAVWPGSAARSPATGRRWPRCASRASSARCTGARSSSHRWWPRRRAGQRAWPGRRWPNPRTGCSSTVPPTSVRLRRRATPLAALTTPHPPRSASARSGSSASDTGGPAPENDDQMS